MTKILVSLLSDQTLPNVLFIKEMDAVDRYIFVSTEKMEIAKKGNWISNGCGINQDNIKTIQVIEDSPWDIEEKLSKIEFEDNDEIIVNLTGGTKIMSIGVYNFFTRRRPAFIYYIPVGKNIYRKIFPESNKKDYQLKCQIGLADYLKSYGIAVITKDVNKIIKSQIYTNTIFEIYLNGNRLFFDVVEMLRLCWRNMKHEKILISEIENSNQKKNELSCAIPKLSELIENIKFPLKDDGYIYKEEIEYLTGGWFEEYVYHLIQKENNLEDVFIGINIEFKRANEKNEIDIMYVKDNTLHVIECKTGISKVDGRSVNSFVNEIIHKMTAIRKDFGLIVNSYLYTLTDLTSIKEINYKDRCRTFNINLVDKTILVKK